MEKIIVILGPTASGKTALSVSLARAVGGEVISADSRQVYRGLDVGTGKVTKKEMRAVPHHLLDVADPKKVYSASDFVHDGRKAISEIVSRKRIPIIAGGTGFYIDTLTGAVPLTEIPPNSKLRKKLAGYSLKKLQSTLKKLDPERYTAIDQKNPVRLVRAIEIASALGSVPKTAPKKLYDVLYLGLTLPMEDLKKKIHTRLLKRMPGILREVKKLHVQGLSWKRMEELGLEYRYTARYLQNKISKQELLSELEKEIVKYAKRQMTWFKRNKETIWIAPTAIIKATSESKRFLGLRKKRV